MTGLPAGLIDRARGALIGLAVGDALGTTLEFEARDANLSHTEMTGGGHFGVPPGVWTDDTSLALALADSLIACRRFDAKDVMDRFLSWLEQGAYSPLGRCFDIGNTTRQSLMRYRRTREPFAGPVAAQMAGNGSLMRLAPVVLFSLCSQAGCQALAADQSRTTHAAPEAIDACGFFAGLLFRAIHGEDKASILACQDWHGDPAVRAVAMGGWRGKQRQAIRSTGYVVDTLEAALWAVERTDCFEDAVVLAVNLADDADTVGAVTGQLAGALHGMAAIPPRWLMPLAWRERLLAAADALLGAQDTMP